ncbi:Uma2 family endonuclease [Neolewinella sp.]|uniref:Uma2 family endonuclease n=1 Tax=Neolewinella sp. TaxID=2993543 RepID=UPI003B51E9DA
MKTRALVAQLLDHHDPRAVYAEVERTLEREQRERAKFRQRLAPDVKAEFILGEVVVHSPATHGHNMAVTRISTILTTYCAFSKQGTSLVQKALVATKRNDFEPNVSVWLQERAKDFTPDMKYYPAPDLVVEVLSKSTEDRDRGIKYQDYLAAGVSEYWIVDHRTERVEQYLLNTGYDGANVYQKSEHELEDQLTSRVLEGLSVPVASFFYPEPFAEALRRLG